MTSYGQLWAADPAAWSAAGPAWRGLDALLYRRAAEFSEVRTALAATWSGPAGRAAGSRLAVLRSELVELVPLGVEVDQILAEHAARLHAAKARLSAAVTLASAGGVLIDRQGHVTADRAGPQPLPGTPPLPPGERGAAATTRVAGEISAALALADGADRETAGRLGGLATALGERWAAPPGPYRPPPGSDPALVRSWWEGLSPAQRRWLIGHEAPLVGRLDGIPVGVRDQANRLLLNQGRVALLAERAAAFRRLPSGPGQLTELARIDRRLRGLDAIAERLVADSGPRAYLVGLDPSGDGRAIVALGNPDRSDHVLTYVPGMTAGLATVEGELNRADRLARRCAELGPTGEASVLLWLDYDAPDFLDEAARSGPAEAAGPGLHRFQEALRLTHEGTPARQTVLGHSYGSVVVGMAARDHGLAADALVFVGSPGVGVDRAEALGVPPEQVWSSTAPDDVIGLARPPAEAAGRAAVTGLNGMLLGGWDDELWFGQNPSSPGFGGRIFRSGPYGHSGYWDPRNPALDGMARIALGST